VVAAGCDHRDFAAEHNKPISFPEYRLGEHRPPLVELPNAQREYLEAFGG
jgi:hypothetical protein